MAGIMFERKERRKNIFLHSLADHPTKGKTDDAVIKYIDNSRRCIVEWGFAYFSRRDYLIYQLTLNTPRRRFFAVHTVSRDRYESNRGSAPFSSLLFSFPPGLQVSWKSGVWDRDVPLADGQESRGGAYFLPTTDFLHRMIIAHVFLSFFFFLFNA